MRITARRTCIDAHGALYKLIGFAQVLNLLLCVKLVAEG